jgi:hypothetical protein
VTSGCSDHRRYLITLWMRCWLACLAPASRHAAVFNSSPFARETQVHEHTAVVTEGSPQSLCLSGRPTTFHPAKTRFQETSAAVAVAPAAAWMAEGQCPRAHNRKEVLPIWTTSRDFGRADVEARLTSDPTGPSMIGTPSGDIQTATLTTLNPVLDNWTPTTPQYSPHDVSDVVSAVHPTQMHTLNRQIKVEQVEMKTENSEANSASPSITEALSETALNDQDEARRALELKRTRNRECMRRSRNRKMGEIASMKSEIAHLEEHLRKMQVERAAALASRDASATSDTGLERVVDALQRENFALRDAIREKDKLREMVAPLLEQEQQRITLDVQQHDEPYTDQFAWLRHVVPLLRLKSMGAAEVAALVRKSCEEIVASAQQADEAIPSPNLVLGWSDKRIVDVDCVRFVFSKDFPHQSIDEIATKSWVTSSDLNKVKAFQPRAQNMVCLHRWDDNTVVVARNLPVAHHGSEVDRNYCSVILLFRLETPSGFVVGTRTLEPSTVPAALLRAGEFRATYVDICYGLLFTPLRAGCNVGCNVRFGGRSGNGTLSYSKVCAMDVLLATLRWENYCIAPLNRLGR